MTTQTLFNDVEVAELYARHRGEVDQDFIDDIAASCGPAGRLLDIGAGTGGPAACLQDRGFDVVCVEPSPEMISEGRRTYPGLNYVRAAGEDVPLRDATFDAATVLYVLHHVDDPEAVLAQARRLIRPDGRVVVATGDSTCDRQRFFQRYFPTLHPDLPGAEEVSVYARAAGLDVIESRTVDHWIYPHRQLDEAYLRMVRTQMFATLRDLAPDEFHDGLKRLQADAGRPIPPSKAVLVVLRRS
jgi:SAM-dependent methyltransferase